MALELVGERWSLLVVRELMFGPRRFGELKADLGGISANVLTQRLAGLARAGILIRRTLPSPASVQVYELTPWGYESETAIRELGRWAARSPAHDPHPTAQRGLADAVVPGRCSRGSVPMAGPRSSVSAGRRGVRRPGRWRLDPCRARRPVAADVTFDGGSDDDRIARLWRKALSRCGSCGHICRSPGPCARRAVRHTLSATDKVAVE